ncbi:putative mediator-associated protein 1-like [Heracleum sosnowskyi]|uniref:Mediator-associated protein 1-like n=1 Tax=Heracleum sosnowskyi TaxID=360622 RepID=A0AAD8IXX5_9APIA|nr:putative mediator-associated protein 1-like [Heracleum sosnowskyi]
MARKRSSPPSEIPAEDSDHVDAASDNDEQPIESDPQNDVAEEQNEDEEESQENQEEEDAESEGEGEDDDEVPVNPNEESVEKQGSSQGSESIGKDSGSVSGHGSGSDSESEKSSPVPVKPIRSKPMKVLTKKPDPKVDPKPDPKPKRKRATVKRPVGSDKNGKGGNKRARVSNGDEKKSGINRIWSEDDEIVLLQGMIDYQLANDEDPYSDFEAFYEFVKDSLHVTVSIKQLIDKIRRLKKKYLVNAEKGDDVVFLKPHEDKSFELSKKIWGGGIGMENGNKVKGGRKKKDKDVGKAVNNGVNGKDDVVMEDEIENGVEADEEEDEGLDFKAMYPYLSKVWELDVSCSQPLKEISVGNFQLMGSEKLRAMEKECKDMYVTEMQMYVKKLELKVKHAKVSLDQMINSDP